MPFHHFGERITEVHQVRDDPAIDCPEIPNLWPSIWSVRLGKPPVATMMPGRLRRATTDHLAGLAQDH